jgi:hypothetical protein
MPLASTGAHAQTRQAFLAGAFRNGALFAALRREENPHVWKL